MKKLWDWIKRAWRRFWREDEYDGSVYHLSQSDKRDLWYGAFMVSMCVVAFCSFVIAFSNIRVSRKNSEDMEELMKMVATYMGSATEDEYEEIARTIRNDLVFTEYGQEIEKAWREERKAADTLMRKKETADTPMIQKCKAADTPILKIKSISGAAVMGRKCKQWRREVFVHPIYGVRTDRPHSVWSCAPSGSPAGGVVWREPAKRGNDLSPPSSGLPLCILCARLHPGEKHSGLYPPTKAACAAGTLYQV